MLKSNKLLMILLFCIITPNVIYASIHVSSEGDTLGLVPMFLMVLLTAIVGLYFMRREESKKFDKCCINHNIDRDRNLIEYIAL